MAVLHEVQINQHTVERHSLDLFLSHNVNMKKEYSKTRLEHSPGILKKHPDLLQGKSQRNPTQCLSLPQVLSTCIKMSVC